MWEHFMTKPLVDRGIFRHLADCPTPWPCFVIAVRADFLDQHSQQIKQLLQLINNQTQTFKNQDLLAETLAAQYQLQPDDVQLWLNRTTWSRQNFDLSEFNLIQTQLLDLNILSCKLDYSTTIASLN